MSDPRPVYYYLTGFGSGDEGSEAVLAHDISNMERQHEWVKVIEYSEYEELAKNRDMYMNLKREAAIKTMHLEKENENLKAALRVAFAQSKEAQVKVTISVALDGDLGCIPPGTEVEVKELTGIIVQMQSDIERITQERDEARAVCRGAMRAVKDYLEKHE